jgi:hypothetical protein
VLIDPGDRRSELRLDSETQQVAVRAPPERLWEGRQAVGAASSRMTRIRAGSKPRKSRFSARRESSAI